ncbi:hypothetical protein ABZW44_49460 [Streptomyces mirabilis]|uniref:hypothetical protein n=1 Tax=Streptomyces mirabilis TaxID=68239 RepID=UPI00339F587E
MRHNPFRGHARCDGHGAHGRPEWFTGLWYAIGRHRRGHDPFGGGPFGGRGGRGGFGDFGDDGMPRGRQFSSDDLQLLLLALVGICAFVPFFGIAVDATVSAPRLAGPHARQLPG